MINHALIELNKLKINPEIIVHIRPTTPLIDPKQIDKAIKCFIRNKNRATALRSVHEMSETAYKAFEISKKELLKPILKKIKFLDKVNLNKTSIVENWSPVTKPKLQKIQFYKRKFNPLNKFCFIYSGTLGYKHNPELFIKIAEKFPNSIIIVSSKGKFALKLKKISQRKLLNI